MKSKRLKLTLFAVLSLLALLYIISYGYLSTHGTYHPAAWGLSGPKGYAWVPKGFLKKDGIRANNTMFLIYAPLYLLDKKFWHHRRDAHSGKYPINLSFEH